MSNREFEVACLKILLKGDPLPPTKPFHFVRWHPPPPRFIKINFDGSFINSAAAGGYIIRDWTGKVIKTGAANYGHSSIMVAEARPLRDGVKIANQAGFRKLYIEGDNCTIIKALQGKNSVPWQISTILEDVQA